MSTKASTGLTYTDSICVRFKVGDLARIKSVAGQHDEWTSVWIRRIVVERANKVIEKERVAKLRYTTAQGNGETLCIRFRPGEFAKAKKASGMEDAKTLSTWIRSIVELRLNRG